MDASLRAFTAPRYILLAVFAQLILVLSFSGIHAIPEDGYTALGISKNGIASYIAIIVIMFAAFSHTIRWSWPLMIERVFIVVFAWVLYGSLFPHECLCCEGSSSLANFEACTNGSAAAVYSGIWILVLVTSYLIDADARAVRIASRVIGIPLAIVLVLVPNACNQVHQNSFGLSVMRITLYLLIWVFNLTLRLYENVLFQTIAQIRTDDRRVWATLHPRDMFFTYSVRFSKPLDLRTLYAYRVRGASVFYSAVSWKNRDYGLGLRFYIDIVRGLWVFFVCPPYLVVAAFELLWLLPAIYVTAMEVYTVSTVFGIESIQKMRLVYAGTTKGDTAGEYSSMIQS